MTSSRTPAGSLQSPIASSPSTIWRAARRGRARRRPCAELPGSSPHPSTFTRPWVNRCPKVSPPDGMPATSGSTVCSPSFAQSQRTGREKRRPSFSQIIDLQNDRPRTISVSSSGSASSRGLPGTTNPRKPSRTSSSSAEIPCLRAKPAAAFSRRCSGGPWTHSSGVRSGRPSTSSASLRGPTSTRPPVPPSVGSQRSVS